MEWNGHPAMILQACYQLLSSHQYDKDPDTTRQLQMLVEQSDK